MKRKVLYGAGLFVALILGAVIGVSGSEEPTASAAGDVKTVTVEGQAAPAKTVTVTEAVEKPVEKEAEPAKAVEEAPVETAAQENARESAGVTSNTARSPARA